MATPRRYRHRNGTEHLIDLDASGPQMREFYDAQIARGDLIEVPDLPDNEF